MQFLAILISMIAAAPAGQGLSGNVYSARVAAVNAFNAFQDCKDTGKNCPKLMELYVSARNAYAKLLSNNYSKQQLDRMRARVNTRIQNCDDNCSPFFVKLAAVKQALELENGN